MSGEPPGGNGVPAPAGSGLGGAVDLAASAHGGLSDVSPACALLGASARAAAGQELMGPGEHVLRHGAVDAELRACSECRVGILQLVPGDQTSCHGVRGGAAAAAAAMAAGTPQCNSDRHVAAYEVKVPEEAPRGPAQMSGKHEAPGLSLLGATPASAAGGASAAASAAAAAAASGGQVALLPLTVGARANAQPSVLQKHMKRGGGAEVQQLPDGARVVGVAVAGQMHKFPEQRPGNVCIVVCQCGRAVSAMKSVLGVCVELADGQQVWASLDVRAAPKRTSPVCEGDAAADSGSDSGSRGPKAARALRSGSLERPTLPAEPDMTGSVAELTAKYARWFTELIDVLNLSRLRLEQYFGLRTRDSISNESPLVVLEGASDAECDPAFESRVVAWALAFKGAVVDSDEWIKLKNVDIDRATLLEGLRRLRAVLFPLPPATLAAVLRDASTVWHYPAVEQIVRLTLRLDRANAVHRMEVNWFSESPRFGVDTDLPQPPEGFQVRHTACRQTISDAYLFAIGTYELWDKPAIVHLTNPIYLPDFPGLPPYYYQLPRPVGGCDESAAATLS